MLSRALRHRVAPIAQIALMLVAAVVLVGKWAYASASPHALGFALVPTVKLVSLVTGGHFTFDARAGWVDRDLQFVIAPVCAGVNFLLAAFATIALATVAGMRTPRATITRLALAAGGAYAATIAINATRISIAIALHRHAMSGGDIHQAEGIVVYLGGLCALYAAARALDQRARLGHAAPLPRAWLAAPIAVYLAITIALPALNGGIHRAGFVWHSALVLAACTLVLAISLRPRRAIGTAAPAVITVIAIGVLAPSVARADDVCDADGVDLSDPGCRWVDAATIERAEAILRAAPHVIQFCERCGDRAPGEPHTFAELATHRLSECGAHALVANGSALPLAALYVQSDVDPTRYDNLARRVGCSRDDVAPALVAQTATKDGVLIVPDYTPTAHDDTTEGAPEPASDPAPAAAPSFAVLPIPMAVPSAIDPLFFIALGALASTTLGGLIVILGARRRRAHAPKATKLPLS